MKASGEQLRAITALADAGTIRPVWTGFSLESTKDAMAYVESGRARGKVVVTMADLPLTHPIMPPTARTPATLAQNPVPQKGTAMINEQETRHHVVTSYTDAPTRAIAAGGVTSPTASSARRPGSR